MMENYYTENGERRDPTSEENPFVLSADVYLIELLSRHVDVVSSVQRSGALSGLPSCTSVCRATYFVRTST